MTTEMHLLRVTDTYKRICYIAQEEWALGRTQTLLRNKDGQRVCDTLPPETAWKNGRRPSTSIHRENVVGVEPFSVVLWPASERFAKNFLLHHTGETKMSKIKVVFCTNLEMVFGNRLASGLDQQNEEWQREVIDDARKLACKFLPSDCDEESSSQFSEWNGGRFSHQAKMYGFRQCGLIAYSQELNDELAAEIETAYSTAINASIAEANRQEAEYQKEQAEEEDD